MANVFLLGPGSAAGAPPSQTHLDVRLQIAEVWRKAGHTVIIMEKEDDIQGEDLHQKFDRLLRRDITDIAIYWPPNAETTSTIIEMAKLAERIELLKKARVPLILVHHVSVLSFQGGEFKILEQGRGSAYLNDLIKLDPRCWPWKDQDELFDSITAISAEL